MNDLLFSRRSYPLSLLFVMVTGCGVITAFTTPVVRAVLSDQLSLPAALAAHFLSALAGLPTGAVLGLYHHRRSRGLFWGAVTGIGVGFMAGPVVLAPASGAADLALTSLGGAAVLLALGAALFGRPPARSSRTGR